HPVHVYPDAEEFIEQRLLQQRLVALAAEIRRDPAGHPLRTGLLQAELLPYQMDGIAFAVGAGRAILADDMGLGKTIQGIGVAELLAQNADIRRVLVICPASLKSQWRGEINRFCGRSSQLVLGSGPERVEQYHGDAFFTICNYEQVLRDHATIEEVEWDLIILDEGQRIKNWESKTSQLIKSLQSPFALVLSGTPLENRLEELYTVVSFIDDRRLGPAYRFFHRHRVVDDRGRVEGYRQLDQLRDSLKPILLRRTRATVMRDLPERTTEIVRITPTSEQLNMSEDYVSKAARIAAKRFLTEMDLLRLQKYLLMARMACDSTFLITKEEPGYSSKLERLDELLEQFAAEEGSKLVLFSEWTTMLTLIEPLLARHDIDFVRLDGQVPQKKRQQLVHRFQNDPECRAIIMSNAGSTGLNLQAANTVINVDLPWNPAVLEQRIARAHRMGQMNPVHVYLLVTEGTIEERLLGTLSAKHDLALAALDFESD
ncbi:MAG: DEAD/DEAH box helicase, partial [Pirellulales bacterium]